jgi:biopolymer transport protein ExbD
LHQNSQKHNQLEKPSISWHPLVNVIYVWLIFFLLLQLLMFSL